MDRQLTADGFFRAYQRAHGLFSEGRLCEAEAALREAWAATGAPTLRSMLLLAHIERDQGRYVSAVRTLLSLLETFSEAGEAALLADAWSVLGESLRALGEADGAVEAFLQAARLEPAAGRRLVEMSNAIFSANALAQGSAERWQTLFARYRGLLGAYLKAAGGPLPPVRYVHERIRVGYLSADFRHHAVAQFLRPFFSHCDASRFSVYAYSLVGPAGRDSATAFFKEAAMHWRDVSALSFREVAQRIRADEIDVLVELAGHTAGNALPVLAFCPASVQLSGIGYMSSTGIFETTGFLSDFVCADAPRSPYFVEPLLRLPHSHFCFAPLAAFPEVAPPPCLAKGYVTLGCFNNFAKVTDAALALWAKILQELPEARLLLKHSIFASAEGRAFSLARLARAGVPLARTELRALTDPYLSEYGDVDLALDPFPYTGGLTTFEALYMGVPVVTLRGAYHGARFGASILENLGLGELVAEDAAGYVAIGCALAKDTELLASLRSALRPMMARSPLMDEAGYMRDVEELFEAWVAKSAE